MVMKHYPSEFRAEAVALYRSRPGATIKSTIKSVSDDLGVNHETLRNWIRLDDAQRTGSSAAAETVPASPEDENVALRRRIRDLEEERDILRKAARCSPGKRAGEPLPGSSRTISAVTT